MKLETNFVCLNLESTSWAAATYNAQGASLSLIINLLKLKTLGDLGNLPPTYVLCGKFSILCHQFRIANEEAETLDGIRLLRFLK
jgi:hypothetical protein